MNARYRRWQQPLITQSYRRDDIAVKQLRQGMQFAGRAACAVWVLDASLALGYFTFSTNRQSKELRS
jgi:hypothetical protein